MENKVIETYHSNGNIHEKYSVNSEDKFDGQYERFYDNGKTEVKCTAKNGKLHGQFESFFENGQTKEKGEYKDGLKIGLWKEN